MKMKFFLTFLFLVVPIMSFAQNSNTSQARDAVRSAINAANSYVKPTPEPPRTKITGRVVYHDTGKPVRRGNFKFLRIEKRTYGNSDGEYEEFETVSNSNAVTNDEGEFVIEGVFAGEYYPSIEVPGVLKPDSFNGFFKTDTRINVKSLDELFERIVVFEGVVQQEVLIRAKRGASISGRITYADGEPAVGVDVEILRNSEYGFESASEFRGKTKTDDRGFYRFSSLLDGEYLVRTTEATTDQTSRYSQYSSVGSEIKTYYPDSPNAKEAKRIELSQSEEKVEINITIPDRKTFTISGKVVSKANCTPIAKARISFSRKDEMDALGHTIRGNNNREIFADEKGEWKIADLPKGNYLIEISPPYEYSIDPINSDKKSNRKSEPKYTNAKKEISIEDKNSENNIVELTIASQVSGTLMFEDKRTIGAFSVFLYDEAKDLFSYTNFDSAEYEELSKVKQTKWDFKISDVATGAFQLSVNSEKDKKFYIKSATLDGTDLLRLPIIIDENTEIKGVLVVLASDVGTLKGRIEINDEKLLKSLRIILVPSGVQNPRALIESVKISNTGEFEVNAAPQEYFLVVETIENLIADSKLKHAEWVRKVTQNAEKVTLKPKETTTITIKK